MVMDSNPVIGLKFNSYDEVLHFLRGYQQKVLQVFVTRDSKSLASSHLLKPYNENLQYSHLQYVCKFGKKNYKSKSKNHRNTSSFKVGCKAFITFHISKDKNFLEITDLHLEHDFHNGSEAFIKDIPENRKLSPETVKWAVEAMNLKCSKKCLQYDIKQKKGINIRTKDLSNIHRKFKKNGTNNLCDVQKLLEQQGANVYAFHKEKQYKGLYFATTDMKSSFQAWPEVIFLDGTYKLLNSSLSLMLLLVEDSDGLSEIVGAALLAHEDYLSMKWFLETFYNENKQVCHKIKCFMTDKDLVERKVINEIFPWVNTLICRFHVLKIFDTHVTTMKMNISHQERELCLNILRNLVYSESSDEYDKFYSELINSAPKNVLDYFTVHWHPIKEQWSTYAMLNNFENYTNNRLESINGKIKQLVSLNSYYSTFVTDFFKWLCHHNLENDAKASKNFIKVNVRKSLWTYCEQRYSDLLTITAFQYVKSELENYKYINIQNKQENCNDSNIHKQNIDQPYYIKHKSVILTVHCDSCQCSRWLSIFLPCRHIFAVRNYLGLSLFSEELCALRWTKSYYRQHQRAFRDKEISILTKTVVSTVSSNYDLMSSDIEKLEELKYLLNDVIDISSRSCGYNFDKKKEIICNLREIFDKGLIVTVQGLKQTYLTSQEKQSYKVISVNSKRKIVKQVTDKILESFKSSRSKNFTFTFETLKEVINFWRDGLDIKLVVNKDIDNDKLITNGLKNINLNFVAECDTNHNTIITDKCCKINDIVVPNKVFTRGRPKGQTLTVIGLPKSRGKLIPFFKKSVRCQIIDMLKWLGLTPIIIENVMNKSFKVKKDNISSVCDAFMDDNINLNMLEEYFEEESFKHLTAIIVQKKKKDYWECIECKSEAVGKTILCEHCLLWFHYKCVNLKRKPSYKTSWFCPSCKSQYSK